MYWVLQWMDNWRQWFLHRLISSNDYFIMENNSPFWIHNLQEDCWLSLVWTRSQPYTVFLPLFQFKLAYLLFIPQMFPVLKVIIEISYRWLNFQLWQWYVFAFTSSHYKIACLLLEVGEGGSSVYLLLSLANG